MAMAMATTAMANDERTMMMVMKTYHTRTQAQMKGKIHKTFLALAEGAEAGNYECRRVNFVNNERNENRTESTSSA